MPQPAVPRDNPVMPHAAEAAPARRSRLTRAQWATVIAAGIVLGLGLGHRHANGLYQLPVAGELGISREAFSFAIALQNLVWGLAMPFSGWMADRFNLAWVLAGGLVLYATGLVFAASATSAFGLTLTMGLLVGLGLSATTWIVNNAVSRSVPPERRSEALGVTGSLGAAAQFLLLPLVSLGIAQLGWRGMLLATALLFASVAPLLLALRTKPQPPAAPAAIGLGVGAAVDLRTMFRSKALWLVWLGFASCGFHLVFIAVHLPAYLADKQLPGHVAATALALIGLFNIAGTYVLGLVGERYPKRKVLAGIYLVRTLAIVAYVTLPVTATSTLVFAATMGFLWLATAPLTTGLVASLFGIRSLAMLFGWVFLGHQIGGFLGAWLGGYVYDLTGSYALVWAFAVAIGIVSVVTNWLVDEPRGPRLERRTAAA
jgi:MFS family permease